RRGGGRGDHLRLFPRVQSIAPRSNRRAALRVTPRPRDELRRADAFRVGGKVLGRSTPAQALDVVEQRGVAAQRGQRAEEQRQLALLSERRGEAAAARDTGVPCGAVGGNVLDVLEPPEDSRRRLRAEAG